MRKLDSVNWGIIGVGNVTEVKSGPAFYKVKHSRLVAVMRLVDELRGVGKCVSTGESGARTSRVLDEMVKDYYKHS